MTPAAQSITAAAESPTTTNQSSTATAVAQPSTDVRTMSPTIIAVAVVIFALQYAQAVIIPVVLGLLISYALEPIVAFLVKWKIPRAVAAAVVLLSTTATSGLLLYGLRSEATAIVDQLPDAARRLRQIVETIGRPQRGAIARVQKAATELEKAANAAAPPPPSSGVQRVQVDPPPFSISDYLMWGSIGIATAAGQAVWCCFSSTSCSQQATSIAGRW